MPLSREASTGLNWADECHRVLISQNLRVNTEILAGEILLTRNPGERHLMLHDLQRSFTRLAVCDMDAARKAERRIETEMRKDSLCRITLEKMADMMFEANVAHSHEMKRTYLIMGRAFALLVKDEGLNEWFATGPYAGLGRLAYTIGEMDIDEAMKEREALPELCDMARRIPLDQGVDEEKIESQIFRDGLQLFRRDQGLEKYPHEK